jgi:hypothetical protein
MTDGLTKALCDFICFGVDVVRKDGIIYFATKRTFTKEEIEFILYMSSK